MTFTEITQRISPLHHSTGRHQRKMLQASHVQQGRMRLTDLTGTLDWRTNLTCELEIQAVYLLTSNPLWAAVRSGCKLLGLKQTRGLLGAFRFVGEMSVLLVLLLEAVKLTTYTYKYLIKVYSNKNSERWWECIHMQRTEIW